MQIKKEYKFYAAHRNQELNDKCQRPHGHDYKVFCVFDVQRKGSISTLFNDFDEKMEPFFKLQFDHRMLIDKNDDLLPFLQQYERETNKGLGVKVLPFATSVENVCFYIFHYTLKFGFELSRIELQETRTSTVIYTYGDYLNDKKNFSDEVLQSL